MRKGELEKTFYAIIKQQEFIPDFGTTPRFIRLSQFNDGEEDCRSVSQPGTFRDWTPHVILEVGEKDLNGYDYHQRAEYRRHYNLASADKTRTSILCAVESFKHGRYDDQISWWAKELHEGARVCSQWPLSTPEEKTEVAKLINFSQKFFPQEGFGTSHGKNAFTWYQERIERWQREIGQSTILDPATVAQVKEKISKQISPDSELYPRFHLCGNTDIIQVIGEVGYHRLVIMYLIDADIRFMPYNSMAAYWLWNFVMHSYDLSSEQVLAEYKLWHQAFVDVGITQLAAAFGERILGACVDLKERRSPFNRITDDQYQQAIANWRTVVEYYLTS